MSDQPNFAPPHHLRDDIGAAGHAGVSYGPDDGWLVTFREEPEFMEYLSKQCGNPIYRNRLMTRMISPGNTKTVWDHPTTGIAYEMAIDEESGEVHTIWEVMEQCENGDVPEPVKFPKAWARFLKKTEAAIDGFPIEEWGVVSRTYAQSLKSQNIHTVQQLAALTDSNAQNVMGAIKYRDLAKAWLSEKSKVQILSREQERASRAEEKVKLLEKDVSDLKQVIARLQMAASQAPGAPPAWAGDRPPAAHQETGPQLRKMSIAQAKKKRGGPPKGREPKVEAPALPDAEDEAA